jgi:hypothetical protein
VGWSGQGDATGGTACTKATGLDHCSLSSLTAASTPTFEFTMLSNNVVAKVKPRNPIHLCSSLSIPQLGKSLVLRRSQALTDVGDSVLSKYDLDDAQDEFFRGENREQERQERSRRGGGQTGDVLESERDWTHLAHHGIAVAKISERLDIA